MLWNEIESKVPASTKLAGRFVSEIVRAAPRSNSYYNFSFPRQNQFPSMTELQSFPHTQQSRKEGGNKNGITDWRTLSLETVCKWAAATLAHRTHTRANPASTHAYVHFINRYRFFYPGTRIGGCHPEEEDPCGGRVGFQIATNCKNEGWKKYSLKRRYFPARRLKVEARGGRECVEQSRVAILEQNEMVNEPCASDLMRIYNLDIAPTALFELRRVGLRWIYKECGCDL